MSDATVTSDTGRNENAPKKPVSRRGRRLFVGVIIVLLLALVGITALLLTSILPSRAEVARDEDAGGLIWVKSIYGWGSGSEDQLYLPRKVSIDRNGTIWTTDRKHQRVLGFSPEGKLVEQAGQDVTQTVTSYGAAAIGPEDALYAAEPDLDRIRVFDSSMKNVGTFAFPQATDLDIRDDMMVIGSQAGFAIVDPATGQPVKVVGTRGNGPEQFDTVAGIAIADNGTIYLLDAYNNRLRAFDKDGKQVWTVATGAAGNEASVTGAEAMMKSQETSAAAKLLLPADITIDGNGRLVVVDSFDMSISVFSPKDGKFLAKYGAAGVKDGQFTYPSSIAYDPARDWFAVADSGNHRVQIVRIPGSGSGAATGARRLLSGPLRACIAPLALLLLALVAGIIMRARRKRKAAEGVAAAPTAQAVTDSDS